METPGSMQLAPACTKVATDTESTRSDLSSFSCSPPMPQSPRFRLEEGYPSITTTLEHSRRLYSSKDSQAMRGIAQVFSQCLSSIVSSMDSLPEEVRTFPDFELARYGAVFANGLVVNHAKNLDEDGCGMVLNIMEMAFANLGYLLEVAGNLYYSHKALPAPPPPPPDKLVANYSGNDELATSMYLNDAPPDDDEQTPLINVSGAMVPPQNHRVTTTPESYTSEFLPASTPGNSESEPVHLPTPKRSWQFKGPSLAKRVVGLRPSLGSLLSNACSKSSITLVGSVDQSAEDAEKQRDIEDYMRRHKALPPIPYILRQSAIYFLPDPLHPEVDVDMPELSGETVAVRLSPQGEVNAASLSALIRMVTSKDVIKNPRISELFFCGLGYLICPLAAIAKLGERFHELPPAGLDAAQLRVWTREALTVRIRVGHVVALWLEQYWDSDIFDASVLAELQPFVLNDLLGRIPDSLFNRIILFLEDVSCERATRTKWRKKFIDNMSGMIPVLHPTGYEVALLQNNNFTFQLSQLFVPRGVEELARHLTATIRDMHRAFDPGKAIRCWLQFKGNHSEVHSKLQTIVRWERSLYFWVIREVLNRETKAARVDVIEFWVRVAWECLSLRNFSCASAIHGALVSPPIYRLKGTLMEVDVQHKRHFKTLHDYFCGFENYGKYRQAIDDLMDKPQPYIPILPPLIRDIEVAKTVKPTVPLSQADEAINLTAVGVIQRTLSVLENSRLPYKFECTAFITNWLSEQLDNSYAVEGEQEITAQLDQLSASLEAKSAELEHVDVWMKTFANESLCDLDQLSKNVDEKKPSILNRFFRKS
ncbi:ras GEF [Marasmius fiardii PR-910]|nr:ras GEF [Marasmius fiardii PR-910]